MSERTVEALLSDVEPAVRDVLRRAYETGFRDGIAERRGPAQESGLEAGDRGSGEVNSPSGAAAAGAERLLSDAPPSLPETPAPTPLFAWDQDSVTDDDDDEENDAASNHRKQHRRRVGIRTSSTVGLLRKKIEKAFLLKRFDIDVIIVRAGDRERRQIPSNVKLSAYLREE